MTEASQNKSETIENRERIETAAPFDCLYKLSGLTLEIELKRDANLDKVATQTMTAITILSVAYITPAKALFDYYSFGSMQATGQQRVLAFVYITILLLLLVSFLFVLASRALRKSMPPDSPHVLFSDFSSRIKESEKAGKAIKDIDLANYYCNSIAQFFETTAKKNDRSWRLIKWAMHLLSTSAIIAVLSLLIAFVGYIS